MTVQAQCTEDCTREPDCAVCHRRKKPLGRSLPLAMENGYCGHDCPGYMQDPQPGHLFHSEWRAHVEGDHSGCTHGDLSVATVDLGPAYTCKVTA